MTREFAKWILDVAKYMLTALLLSSVFVDLSNTWVFISLIILIILFLIVGLYMIKREDDKDMKKLNSNKKK